MYMYTVALYYVLCTVYDVCALNVTCSEYIPSLND